VGQLSIAVQPSKTQGWAVTLSVLVTGTFLAVLGTSVINVAIPYIQKDLGVSQDDVRWVSTAYLLSLGVAVPLSGWLAERMGLARTFLYSLITFTVASGLCAISWDITSLLAFRVMQAFPAGIITVVSMLLLYRVVPPERLGVAMGLYGLGVIMAPAIGPVLGGYLVQYSSWHAIFVLKVGLGVVAVTTAAILLPRPASTSRPRFDFLGYLTISLGLVALMLAADRGPDPEWGWTDMRVLGLAVFGLLSLALFVLIELEVSNPLINLKVFRSGVYNISLVLTAINSIGMFALLYYVPQFLLSVRGYEAFETGLILVPSAVAMAVMGPFAGYLVDRIGPKWPAAMGLLISAVGSLLLAQITIGTPREVIVLWTTIRNVGVGLAMMPCMSAGLNTLPSALLSPGSAMSNVVLRVSSSVGVAGFGALVSTQAAQLISDRMSLMAQGLSHSPPELRAAAAHGAAGLGPYYKQLSALVTTTTYADAFFVLAVMTLAAAVLALFLKAPSRAPAPTESPAAVSSTVGSTTTGPTAAVRSRAAGDLPTARRPAPDDGPRYPTRATSAGSRSGG
jgi:EmrB/QacA subfamily drug resistance transporter